MALVTLALPGAVFLYNGQELGLGNVELPDERCGIRRGNARAIPSAAATDAASLFRGAATLPRSVSRHRRTPGCRCRRSGRH